MINVLIGLLSFIVFVFIQALFINGLKLCFDNGEILDWWPKFVNKYVKSEKWKKPLYSCVKCLSSTAGSILYWSFVLMVFGVYWQEIVVWIADIISLVFVNFYLYKRA